MKSITCITLLLATILLSLGCTIQSPSHTYRSIQSTPISTQTPSYEVQIQDTDLLEIPKPIKPWTAYIEPLLREGNTITVKMDIEALPWSTATISSSHTAPVVPYSGTHSFTVRPDKSSNTNTTLTYKIEYETQNNKITQYTTNLLMSSYYGKLAHQNTIKLDTPVAIKDFIKLGLVSNESELKTLMTNKQIPLITINGITINLQVTSPPASPFKD
ncbi:hypothetical protein JD969_18170 [Planctomycetota bacterium]|nr:hypothetical protein JD969_18170 [Planctomycetota bacterium]